jgi:D-glycero-alpha-D-manno-heptose 1-phosphate guanylyltransferase
MVKEAVILAGGIGTRLKSLVNEIPKPMALIENLPFLTYVFKQLQKYGFKKVILAVGFKHEIVRSYFGDSFMDMQVVYSVEKEPLGTGGAISKASKLTSSDYFFVLNGDTFFEVDLELMEEKFLQSGSVLMVALKPMADFYRYGGVVTTGENIDSFSEKKFCKTGLINGGIYILSRNWLKNKAIGKVYSFEKDVLEKWAGQHEITHYISDGYFIDIGVPEDYLKASEELPLHFR